MKDTVDLVRHWVHASTRIVALTGAGISTESGIPDFRGPQGVWTKNPKAERLSNIHYYMSDPEVRRLAWQSRLEHPAWHADAECRTPRAGGARTPRHAARARDAEHRRPAPAAPATRRDTVIEVHGTMREVMCMACEWRGPMGPVLDRVRAGEEDPPCERCGGILKSATISFGQSLEPDVIERAMRAAERADLLLAIGTSLQVYPVAGAVPLAKPPGARVGDRQRRADAVRRDRRCGAARADRRDPAADLRRLARFRLRCSAGLQACPHGGPKGPDYAEVKNGLVRRSSLPVAVVIRAHCRIGRRRGRSLCRPRGGHPGPPLQRQFCNALFGYFDAAGRCRSCRSTPSTSAMIFA